MKRGKKYVEAAKTIDRGTLYDVADAVSLVKKTATAKFDETIEAHIRTGCDGRHADQQIRGAVVLPHGTGKKVRILVFAKDAKAEEAIAAGADYVGGMELIEKIQIEIFHMSNLALIDRISAVLVCPRRNKSHLRIVNCVCKIFDITDIDLEGYFTGRCHLYTVS